MAIASANCPLVTYKRIQRQFPDFVDAWINGSVVLLEMGRSEEALEMALKAVDLGPEDPAALYTLIKIQYHLGFTEESIASSEKIIKLAGHFTTSKRFAEALAIYDRFIHIHPSNPALLIERGYAKTSMMDLAGAEEDYAKAVELDSSITIACWNLAYVHLLQYRYHEAWPNLRSHIGCEEWLKNKRDFGKPQWQGESLDGRTLLIYYAQGFGDTIQFSRFIPQLKQFGGRVLYWIPRALQRLLTNCASVDTIAIEGEPLPKFDLTVSDTELPVILDVGISDLAPLPPPTLPEPQTIPELNRPGFKVGLTWAGNKGHDNDHYRSMNPHYLDELADMEGIAWYGLQLPKATVLPNLPGIIDLSHHMNDFLDSAQLIRQLDMAVTVDTSMAHLAGFLGLPAVVLLPFKPDWRWGATGKHTPWYPSLTLLRQPAHGDWKSVISELRILITERINLGNK